TGILATSAPVSITNVGYHNQSYSFTFDPDHAVPNGFLTGTFTLSPGLGAPYVISFYNDAGTRLATCGGGSGMYPTNMCMLQNQQPRHDTTNGYQVFVALDSPAQGFP